MNPACYVNGQFIPLEKAGLPVGDLGLQRGYGIFDFIRVTRNVPLYIDDHLERFYNSAGYMRLDIGKAKEELKREIVQLIGKNNLPDSGLRILLTGGISADGYTITQPNLVIIQLPLTPPPAMLPAPYKLITHAYQRNIPHVKTTDYIMAVWLQPRVKEQGADDVLYRQNDMISECPRSNFFLVNKDDTVVTPEKNILQGITRKQVLQLAAENGIVVEQRDVSLNDIKNAKAAFISSSTKRIIPVRQIDGHIFENGDTTVAGKLFQLLLERENVLMAGRTFQ